MPNATERNMMNDLLLNDIKHYRELFNHWMTHYKASDDPDLKFAYGRNAKVAYSKLCSAERMYNDINEEPVTEEEEG